MIYALPDPCKVVFNQISCVEKIENYQDADKRGVKITTKVKIYMLAVKPNVKTKT